MIVGTAGHVDHGKTTLVRALTGVDADRLPEEKRRGMTIDLGYAYDGPLGFIDVPGHERFVHTMLAGASGIDAALLVVAADDGVMPQTREHAEILDLLGIDRGVVAITRADRAPERVSEVADEIRLLLAGSALADIEVIAASGLTGEGVDALRSAIMALGARTRDGDGYPRLAVDRAFTVAGAGLVVTGTLVAGSIAVDDRLMISPAGVAVRVRGLHAHNRPAERAGAGARVALNLVGATKDQVARGDWVLAEPLHAPTTIVDAKVRWLAEPPAGGRGAVPVHVHLAATHVTGRVAALDASSDYVRLALDKPIGVLTGDRLVLRDAGATRTLAGGLVIDPFPPRRGARTAGRLEALASLALPPAEALRAAMAEGWTELAAFVRARNLRPDAALRVMSAAGAVTIGPHVMPATGPADMRAAMIATLATWHRDHPDEPGLQPDRLRRSLAAAPPAPLFRAVLETALKRGDVQQDGPWLRLPTHRAVLSPQDERVWAAVRPLIAAERFRPPRTRDFARALKVPEPAMRALLKRLVRMGRLVEVAHDHFFLRETVAEMVATAAALAETEGMLRAASFRDRLNNGRKVAIQILEFFDAVGVTRRKGDERAIRRDRMDLFGPAA